MTIHIYALIDPRAPRVYRYIGQTFKPSDRLKRHYNAKEKSTADWVKSVIADGFTPALIILETTDEVHARQREAHYIRENAATVFNRVQPDPDSYVFEVSPIVSMCEMERRYIAWALYFFDGNKLATCKALGIGRQTLYNKLKAHGLGR